MLMNKDVFIAEKAHSMLDAMQVCEQLKIPRGMLLEPINVLCKKEDIFL